MVSIIGDTHGDNKAILNWNKSVKDSTLIHVGDSCIQPYDLEVLDYKFAQNRNKLLLIRGNHESTQYSFEGQKWGEGNVETLRDYSFRTLEGKNYLFIGGAISLDRVWRRKFAQRCPGLENWYREDEALVYKPELLPNDVEILITHTAPVEFLPKADPNFLLKFAENDNKLLVDIEQERANITSIYNQCAALGVRKSYFGHWHMSESGEYRGIKYRGLNINEITYE